MCTSTVSDDSGCVLDGGRVTLISYTECKGKIRILHILCKLYSLCDESHVVVLLMMIKVNSDFSIKINK